MGRWGGHVTGEKGEGKESMWEEGGLPNGCLSREKIKILDRIKHGEPRQRIVKETGVGVRPIERWLSNEEQMRKEADSGPPSRKRKRTGKHEDVEEALGKCFESVRNQKQIVHGQMLLKKSAQFAEKLGSNFKPNTG